MSASSVPIKAWLTIDDSPSSRMDEIVDFLAQRGVPAIFFCRGDLMEDNPDPVIRAIGRGFVIGNHLYEHRPSGEMTYEEVLGGIEKTENLIERAYAKAGVEKPGRYFRFPYIDRGDGDKLERRFPEILEAVAQGRSLTLARSEGAVAEKREKIAAWLRVQGFIQPYGHINHPLYRHPEIAAEPSCLFTYSTGDWMMNARHLGRYGVYGVRDLMDRIDADLWLGRADCSHAILVHDQEETHAATLRLIAYFLEKGFVFQPIATAEKQP